MDIKIGTFNLFNLVKPGERYYNKKPYSDQEFREKSAWIAGQLKRMGAHFVGFQEVFHESALKQVIRDSGLFEEQNTFAPGANGDGPRVGFATTLPLLEPPTPIADFPEKLDFSIEGVPFPVSSFRRPVLKVGVRFPNGQPVTIFNAHLKSKRPMVAAGKQHDPIERTLGKARSLIVRAAEAAALRSILVDELQQNQHPVIVLGDLNDAVPAVTTEMVAGSPPWRYLPAQQKKAIWDVLLYSTYDIQARRSFRDVNYSQIHNGRYETLDHILVSQEFYRFNPNRIGEVNYLRFFNDHLIDETLSNDRPNRIVSDHGQLVVTLRLREERPVRRAESLSIVPY